MTLRIGRLVLPAMTPAEQRGLVVAFRGELARLLELSMPAAAATIVRHCPPLGEFELPRAFTPDQRGAALARCVFDRLAAQEGLGLAAPGGGRHDVRS
jgi:hypothetical protein